MFHLKIKLDTKNSIPDLQVGDLVFVKSERSKSKARDSYFVLSLDDKTQLATFQKFPMSHFRLHPIKFQYQNLYLASDKDSHNYFTSPLHTTPPPMPSNVQYPSYPRLTVPPPLYTPLTSDFDSEEEETVSQPDLHEAGLEDEHPNTPDDSSESEPNISDQESEVEEEGPTSPPTVRSTSTPPSHNSLSPLRLPVNLLHLLLLYTFTNLVMASQTILRRGTLFSLSTTICGRKSS